MAESKLHNDVIIEKSGLCISAEHGFIAASPDGIFSCSCHENEQWVIEVKCPFTHRDNTLQEAIDKDPKFCLFSDEDGVLHLKKTHSYFYQVSK